MTGVALYSEQPALTAGLQAVIAGLEDFTLSGVFTEFDLFIEHVQTHRPGVVLLEVTAAAAFTTMSELIPITGDLPIILWTKAV